MNLQRIIIVLLCATGLQACKDPYFPPLVDSDNRILVVEGVLNASGGTTSIRLSRSTKIDNYNTIVPEEGAQVTVEAESGSPQNLFATGGGFYRSSLSMQSGQKYRVRIRTSDGKEYLSSYSEAKVTPAIDSISWKQEAEGVTVYANAHDDANTTTYYRWDYEETWEIRTYYYSQYVFENGRVRERNMPDEERYICWKYNNSSNILIASSAKLQSDRIAEAPLLQIPTGNEKLDWRYSILVRQYALDKNAYEFYDLMKKNTESIGTIFDPQPSEIRGNFICITDPAEPVIGHVTASTVTEKRIFINSTEVTDWVFVENCPVQEVTTDSVVYYFEGGGFIPYEAVEENGVITKYMSSYAGCTDCTTRGGSVQRPSYW